MGPKSLSLPEDELVAFVKSGAVRAYKAGEEGRKEEEVSAEFNPLTKLVSTAWKKQNALTIKTKYQEVKHNYPLPPPLQPIRWIISAA